VNADGLGYAVLMLRANAARMRRLLDEHRDGDPIARAKALGAAEALEATAHDLEAEEAPR
jgi:hypothetical protein